LKHVKTAQRDLTHDLALPTLLFAALGGMTWAVRGCSGYGSTAGCIFAGVMWGAAWWFISREPAGERRRRYSSGWIILAVTVGVGLAGNRGWMQWPHFFDGRLYTNYGKGEWAPISRTYGFVWLFLAGVPWAGIGACMLAWCGSIHETRAWHWAIRMACGIGGAYLLHYLYVEYPQYFLPLYESLESQYKEALESQSKELSLNPTLKRMINDCWEAMLHLGFYLGLLLYEIGRREWKNVTLISSVGLINGCGWALCQNWKWAPRLWPEGKFNWWRCWESSGGISIGVALGIAYFLTNRKMAPPELAAVRSRRAISGPNLEWMLTYLGMTALFGWFLIATVDRYWGSIFILPVAAFGPAYYVLRRSAYESEPAGSDPAAGDPTLERFAVYAGLLLGLGLSARSGLKGWFNLYRLDSSHSEGYWSHLLWNCFGPAMIVLFIAICCQALFRPFPRNTGGDRVPKAYALMWLVLIVQNVLGQLVTGPLTSWNEVAFSIYYGLLFAITAVVVLHYEFRRVSREAQVAAVAEV
jgi:hypothetical protein